MQTVENSVYDPFLPTLLLSMHEEYVNEILIGQKVIEYRKRFFKDSFQAFVYTTGKNGGIELFIKCPSLIQNDAVTLAKIGQLIQHDQYEEIYDYFMPKNDGCIIPILNYCAVKKVALEQLRSVMPEITIPQSYLFLDRPDKQKLLAYLLKQECGTEKDNQWEKYFGEIEQMLKTNK